MRRPTPRPTSPMTRRREWPSGYNEGLPQPGIGRQPAHEMLGWQHFGKLEAKEKVFGPLRDALTAPRDAHTARPGQL